VDSYSNVDGEKKQRHVTGSHKVKTEAALELSKAITDHVRGLLSPPDKITVIEYAEQWLKAIRDEGTRKAAKGDLRHALKIIGEKRLVKVTPTDIKNMMGQLAEMVVAGGVRKGRPISPRTPSKILTHLRAIFRAAVVERIVYLNPTEGIKKAKLTRTEELEEAVATVLDIGQDSRFLYVGSALERARMCRLWPALFTTISLGLRKGEAAALCWQNIDFEKNTISVTHTMTTSTGKPKLGPPKTRSSNRTIPMLPSVRRVLLAHLENQGRERLNYGKAWFETDAVFAKEGGGFLHPNQFNRVLDTVIAWTDPETFTRRRKHVTTSASAEAITELAAVVRGGKKLPELRMHDLRHTYATLALRRGEPVATVSKNLGHAKISITLDLYRHVLPSEQHEHVFDLFGAAPTPLRLESRPVN
jgi:integrase